MSKKKLLLVGFIPPTSPLVPGAKIPGFVELWSGDECMDPATQPPKDAVVVAFSGLKDPSSSAFRRKCKGFTIRSFDSIRSMLMWLGSEAILSRSEYILLGGAMLPARQKFVPRDPGVERALRASSGIIGGRGSIPGSYRRY